jgi:hypothetical protein
VFGAAAISVDLGNFWQTRRHLVTASDAAALAAAEEYALGGNGCASVAGSYLSTNFAGAALAGCNQTTTSVGGYVTVTGTTSVSYSFGGVLGLLNKQVGSSTSASFAAPHWVTGLRPIGLCADDAQVKQAIQAVIGGQVPTGTFTITYAKANPNDCGNAPGNWGLLFTQADSTLSTYILNGYPNAVNIGDLEPPFSGAPSTSDKKALDQVIGTHFALPVYDTVSGSGNTAQFHISEFVGVILTGYNLAGPQAQRSFSFQFTKLIVTGGVGPGTSNTGVYVIRICSVPDSGGPNNCPAG